MDKRILIVSGLLLMAFAAGASADTVDSTIYWYVAESVSHTVAYGGSCTESASCYIEPSPIDGNALGLNATYDADCSEIGTDCQNDTMSALTVTNTGSVSIDVAVTTASEPSGVTMKMSQVYDGYEATCGGDPTTGCINLSASQETAKSALAQGDSQDLWVWADFTDVAGMASPTEGTLTTNATQA